MGLYVHVRATPAKFPPCFMVDHGLTLTMDWSTVVDRGRLWLAISSVKE